MKKIIIALIFAVLGFLAVLFDLFGSADSFAEDFLYHRPNGTLENIKIIKIDDKSLAELGDYSDWNREVYASLISKLCVSEEIRPKVIGFDILFSETDGSEADRSFADACAEYGNAVCAFNYVFEQSLTTDSDGNLTVSSLTPQQKIMPYPELYSVTEHGFANALTDNDDSVIRKAFLFVNDEDGREYSLSAQIYRKYCENNGIKAAMPDTDKSGAFSFRYSGTSGDYENVSLSDVLDGTVPPQAFDGCIVLVGAYAAGMMDEYSVPVDRGVKMYGVEIHANVIQALIEGKFITRIPKWVSAVICALMCGAAAFCCGRTTVGKTAAICLSAAGLKLIAGGILFGFGIAGNVIIFPIFCLIILIYYTAEHYYAARRSKRQIENAFKKYVAPQIVEKIAKSGEYTLTLGGESRDIAVLFVDIRGFTPLSESLMPVQVVDILNSYLELTTSCIFRYGGTLDKFVGDATMAVFNAPFDTEDYILRAVMTAWDIVQGGNAIEEQFQEKYGKSVGFGVGVNCGPAVVGNIGCSFRMDYTAIGDTVNTAARLEANAPRGTVYISSQVYEQVKDYISVEEIGVIPLKGKSNGVFVYSITGVNTERIIKDEKNISNSDY